MLPYNNAVLRLSKRAETYEPQHIIDSFVDIGPLFSLLSNPDNQIIFGRRGTGKTHVLTYLSSELSARGLLTAQLDMRTVGSTGGIYSDQNIPLAERATRLLVDTLIAIHNQVLEHVLVDTEALDLSKLGPLLDSFIEAATEITVEGNVEQESMQSSTSAHTSSSELAFSAAATPSFSGSLGGSASANSSDSKRVKTTGAERL